MIGAVATVGNLVSNGASTSAAAMLNELDPFDLRTIDVAYMFTVLVQGLPVGEFHSIEGLSRTVQTEEYYEGGRNEQPLNLIKQGKYGDLTLKWGLVKRAWMYDWMQDVKPGNRFRKDLSILMQVRSGLMPARWYTIIGAYPVEWTAPTIDAQSSSVPTESLKLKFHTMTMGALHVI